MMRCKRIALISSLALAVIASPVAGQSSSLYVQDTVPQAAPQVMADGSPARLSPAIAAVSMAAVRRPEPRAFAVHDLITVIIRESVANDSTASLEASRESSYDGEIANFPALDVWRLLQMQLRPSSMSDGTPKLGVEFEREFEGEGSFRRQDTYTSRVTARVIDIRPNGTLVLEARRYIKTDAEAVRITLTGTARKEDVTANNTLLSTQIYDLHLVPEHERELRKSTKKGILTKFFDALFDF